jgi:hypothetical protein
MIPVENKSISVVLNRDDAWNLALFLKRVGWDEIRANAQDDAEAQAIRAAIERMQGALAEAGYAPR